MAGKRHRRNPPLEKGRRSPSRFSLRHYACSCGKPVTTGVEESTLAHQLILTNISEYSSVQQIGDVQATVTIEGDAETVLEQLELLSSGCAVNSATLSVFTGRGGWSQWFYLATIAAGDANAARGEVHHFERRLDSTALAKLNETLNRLEWMTGR